MEYATAYDPRRTHSLSRSTLDGFPLGDVEKDEKKAKIYFADILGFCVMGNHFPSADQNAAW